MRIAITHPHSWPEVRRGAERMIIEMARSLTSLGHSVTVFTAGSDGGTREIDGYRVVKFTQRRPNGPAHQRWFGARVFPELLRNRFDVVHSLAPHDAAAAVHAARFRGHRTIYEDLGNPYREKVMGGHERRARLRLIADVDVYACMSDFSRRMLEADFGREGTVIPGGVRCDRFQPGVRNERPTVLFSGALDRPEKHVALLLEAVALLAERRPDVTLWLSGPGDVTDLLARAPAAARERVELLGLGDPDAQGERYAAAWVTCLPTQWDSFGLVVIESMASGTPVVVGDVGAPAELVTPTTGRCTEPFNAPTLAERLDEALELTLRRGTTAACRSLAERHDWDTAIVPLLIDLYQSDQRW